MRGKETNLVMRKNPLRSQSPEERSDDPYSTLPPVPHLICATTHQCLNTSCFVPPCEIKVNGSDDDYEKRECCAPFTLVDGTVFSFVLRLLFWSNLSGLYYRGPNIKTKAIRGVAEVK